ncbi:hypothetical protein BDK51DRAFT_29989 [Blyttiomyces helicus]|uniref:MYND-type domain-containing protein n=1 Tax=Blyttiomyces helicus TaxID=388810 RepID=A0A4P9WMM1_9FUNG|nr:hypothetical protein BDK51DRAFT_29989 [Blyttiomyces helicus]|eukprot:RKO94164.1 hypothetical protein BDK51DRAFT_29989 [Blyttiomyces helicus]
MDRIFRSEAEPLQHRITCGYTLGRMMTRMGDLHTATKRCRRALSLAESATAASRSAIVILDGPDVPAGALLNTALTVLRRTLEAGFERPTAPITHNDLISAFEWDRDRSGGGIDFVVAFVPDSCDDEDYERHHTAAIFDRTFRVCGSKCDGCGKKPDASVLLKYYSRCKMAAYCSPACQRGAWTLHRPSCRPPNTFLPGDPRAAPGVKQPHRRGARTGARLWELLEHGSPRARALPKFPHQHEYPSAGRAGERTGPAFTGLGRIMRKLDPTAYLPSIKLCLGGSHGRRLGGTLAQWMTVWWRMDDQIVAK